MKIHRRNGIDFYCFENLAAFPALCHGITTRQGGGSQSPFDSLNMSLHVGDAADQVAANREAVWSGFPRPAEPVFLNQGHGSTVVVWDGKAPSVDPRLSGEADAIVSDQHGWLLTILVADCQPVLLHDPVRSVIANIHSGWRGSIADIIGRTVTVMTTRFGCNPADIYAGVGPSLGPCCSEFVHYRREIPESLWSYRVSENHFDFWAISQAQLVRAGLNPVHIEISRICTRCRRDLFFSYRAAQTTGRFAAIVGMAPKA
jgi:YfiH family protein